MINKTEYAFKDFFHVSTALVTKKITDTCGLRLPVNMVTLSFRTPAAQ